MKKMQTFLENSQEVINAFNDFVIENNLQSVIDADHICFKCDSSQNYEEWRKLFEWEGKNIYQAIISKRRIATVIFKESIKTIVGDINYLELSDQKPDGSQIEDFDHIEFIPKNKSLEEILEIFEEKNIQVTKDVKPHITQYIIQVGKYNFRLAEMKLVDKIKKDEFK